MPMDITVMEEADRFAVLKEGQLQFYQVVEGVVCKIPDEVAITHDHWTSNLHTQPRVPYLRVVFEAESDRSNYQHFWVGTQEEGSNAVGLITTHPDTALWLSNTYGDPKYRSED